MKTHVVLKFDYEDTTWKSLISKVDFPEVIRDAKHIEIIDFSPSAVLFAFTCDLELDDYYSNCIDNLISISLGGVRGRNRYKAKVSGNVRGITVRMRYPIPKEIYSSRQTWALAHLVIHSRDNAVTDLYAKYISAMKSTTLFLKLHSDESQTRQSIDYKLSKSLPNARCIQVINLFASGGYDYVTCPQIRVK